MSDLNAVLSDLNFVLLDFFMTTCQVFASTCKISWWHVYDMILQKQNIDFLVFMMIKIWQVDIRRCKWKLDLIFWEVNAIICYAIILRKVFVQTSYNFNRHIVKNVYFNNISTGQNKPLEAFWFGMKIIYLVHIIDVIVLLHTDCSETRSDQC